MSIFKNIKYCISLLLCVVLLATLMLIGIFSVSAENEGYYTYTVSNGKATITGCDESISGDVTIPSTLGGYPVTRIGDYAFYNCGSLTSIAIPDSVTSIGEGAFSYCGSLESITIPDGVTSISDFAFHFCSILTSITIPDSVTSIGEQAFGGTRLTSITIPESVTSIGRAAFSSCRSLRSITIPESVTSIGDYAFSNCTCLTSVFYKGTTQQKNYMEISLKNNDIFINTIWHYKVENAIFDNENCIYCPECNDYFLSNGKSVATKYYSYFFTDGEITIYYVDPSISGDATIPSTLDGYPVTAIGEYAFYNCDSLTSITIPESVTSIGDSAFSACSNLTSITIPDSVTSIGDFAFRYCESLESITIPDSVTEIGDSAFAACSSLENVYIENIVAWCNIDFYNEYSNPLYFADYLYLNGELITKLVIPNDVTTIPTYAFSCKNITSITVSDSVTSIEKYAFYDCSNLESITLPFVGASQGETSNTHFGYIFGASIDSWMDSFIPKSLKEVILTDECVIINGGAFSNCENLENIIISDSVTSIGEYAFFNCSNLKSVTIGNGVTSIGEYAFYYCESLESITLPFVGASQGGTSNTHFGYIFGASSYSYNDDYVPSSLKNVILTDKCTTIDDNAFRYCESLESIIIGNHVTSIGEYAFFNCSNLKSVTIGNGVTSISSSAFYDCISLKSINVYSNNTSYTSNDGVLFNKDKSQIICYSAGKTASSYTIPDSVTSIGDFAFRYCESLESITIPDSVTEIGDSAFAACSSLENVYIEDIAAWCNIDFYNEHSNPLNYANYLYLNGELVTSLLIPDSVTSIGDYTFYSCSSLESITIPDSITTIGDEAFYYCIGLTSITIPDSVTEIGDYAFSACFGLKRVTIGNSVKSIGNWAFFNCSRLTSITIPSSVTSIGNGTFYWCYELTNANINNGVISIGDMAFYGSGLTDITIPNSVISIGEAAFLDCDALTKIIIGNGTTSIGYYAFSGCHVLKDVFYSGTEEEWGNISIDEGNNYLTNANIHYNYTENEAVEGDTNGDGEVNVLDAISLRNSLLGKEADSETADMNGDSVFDIYDLLILKAMIFNNLPKANY